MMRYAWFAGHRVQVQGGGATLDTTTSQEFAPYRHDGRNGMMHRHGRTILHTVGARKIKVLRCATVDDAVDIIRTAWAWHQV